MSAVSDVVASTLQGLEHRAPTPLLKRINALLAVDDLPALDEPGLVELLCDTDPNAFPRLRFQVLISGWDAQSDDAAWADGTTPGSAPRRSLVLEMLGFSGEARARLNSDFPREPAAIVIEAEPGDWSPWYYSARTERDFYWKAYRGVLERGGWPQEARSALDQATSAVVSRLADPSWEKPYQSKGLVVGYVQSGKTANFTGVLAKSIDAGYRLIIVLTGTIELLRKQTQRRLDMELVGKENIVGGRDLSNPVVRDEVDYHNDQDWDSFLQHGVRIHAIDDVPEIRRLTSYDLDYKRLDLGLSALDFRVGHELVDKSLPLYDPKNLYRSGVRLAVVKKNSTVLKKLVSDLQACHVDLKEIPTLIIDDEADQASVNTKKPKPTEERERTAINREISNLLHLLPRAQYVGYTATPFANVFVDPDDSADIFPRDFIVSLERPRQYMGAREFHDLDLDPDEERTLENSNEKAFVRDLWGDAGTEQRTQELRSALDSFVLAGAIKIYREGVTGRTFRHHTMLVHESVKMAEHALLAQEIRELWRTAGYDSPSGLARLQELYESDFAPTTQALRRREIAVDDGVLPESFETLVPAVGEALDRIETGASPVIVVNGDKEKDYEQDDLDFQTSDVWKILVGGTKLSRGFTVEGLTITYYTRRTQQEDTLMQMGRWFGFRPGYRDLVRLFIGRAVPGPGGRAYDLYGAFEAAVRDEEDFREELRRFAGDEQSQVRPIDVPPMVFQHLTWLKPTAATKMYNARMVRQGEGGKVMDFTALPPRGTGATNRRHLELVAPLLQVPGERGEFRSQDGDYEAEYSILDATAVLDVLEKFEWARQGWFDPYLTFARDAVKAGTLVDFALIKPSLSGVTEVPTAAGVTVPLSTRTRRTDRGGFSGSSKRQRPALQGIADHHNVDKVPTRLGGPLAQELCTGSRAGLLFTFAYDGGASSPRPEDLGPGSIIDSRDVATMFTWTLPYLSAPGGKIGFMPLKSGAGLVVDSRSVGLP